MISPINLLKALTQRVCDQIVGLAPNLFLTALYRRHPNLVEAIARKNAPSFKWENVSVGRSLEQFDDLSPLFWNTTLNRGLLRQDFDEASTLFKTVRSINRPQGVEIGRFHGASTLLLAVAVGAEGKLTSIDLAPQDDDALRRVLKSAGVASRVNLVVGDANEVSLKEELDFAFIDGDHSYEGAKRDHNKWGKLVRKGGYVIHHDMACQRKFATQWDDLARLREQILKQQSEYLELACEIASLAVFRRRSGDWTNI
jgi:predicted O-methyltransferase YrrM